MMLKQIANEESFAPRQPIPHSQEIGDVRFRALLPKADWESLSPDIQRRFTKRLQNGAMALFKGSLSVVRMNTFGRVLSQLLRVIGAPLPLSLDVDVPSVVAVVEEGVSAGQVWTRLYAHKEGLPQVIHSVKRFSGATGLEEYLGYGLSVALKLSVEGGALCFRSAFYQLHLGHRRFRLPDILSPGSLKVVHEETNPGEFIFSLKLRHSWFGELVYQEGVYRDAK